MPLSAFAENTDKFRIVLSMIRQAFWAVLAMHRSTLILLISALALIGALVFSWVSAPSISSAEVTSAGILRFETSNSWVPVIFKLFFAFLLPLVCVLLYVGQKSKAIKVVWILFSLTLLFPSVINYWDVQFKLDTESIDASLNLVVNELESQHDAQQGDWRVWQDISALSSEFIIQAPSVATWNGSLLLAKNIPQLTSGILGLSDSFLTFAAKGWVLALIGCLLAVLGFYTTIGQGIASFRAGGLYFVKVFFVLFLCIQIPAFVADYYYARGDYYEQTGLPQNAIESYEIAMTFKPAYAHEPSFLHKYGRLFKQMSCERCLETLLYEAISAIKRSDINLAYLKLLRAEQEYPNNKKTRLLLANVLSFMGTSYFNNQQYSYAAELWRQSIGLVPTSSLPWYGLSLASVLSRDFDDASLFSQQVYALQQNMGFKSLVVPAQIHLYRSWFLFSETDFGAAHEVYRYSKLPESW